MIELLNAINANIDALESGDFDYPPFSRDLRIGAAVTNYLIENEDAAYLMPQIVATAVQAGAGISTASLYRARAYYLQRANAKRKSRR